MGICRAVCCMVRGWMRYAALPPAFMRGVPPVRKLVAGGVRYPHLFHKKRTRNKDGKNRKVMLFYALLPEIRTPPATSVGTGGTPLTSAGGEGGCAASPTNSNLSVCCVKPICINHDFRAVHSGGADFCLRPPYLCPAAVNKNEEIPLTFY